MQMYLYNKKVNSEKPFYKIIITSECLYSADCLLLRDVEELENRERKILHTQKSRKIEERNGG